MRQRNILDDIYDFIGRFIAYPSDHARMAHTLWIAHTHLIDAFYTTPRLAIISAEKQSGKTRLLEITKLLVRNPIASMNMSPAAMYTAVSMSEVTPTILLDEIDRLFERTETADIVALINAGFQRGEKAYRCSYDAGTRKLEPLEAFCPVLLAGIDKQIPDTIIDRSIVVRMKRRSDAETVEPYRPRDNEQEGVALRQRLETLAKGIVDRAKEMRPSLPDGIEDRNADKWEPLFVCAKCYGVTDVTATWEARVQQAALAFLNEERETEPSLGILLLKDARDIYHATDTALNIRNDKISTDDLLRGLFGVLESPWSCLNGRALDQRGLARRLSVYGIHPKTIRIGPGPKDTIKGYDLADFHDAWRRYLPPVPAPQTGVTRVTPVTVDPVASDKVKLAAATSGSPVGSTLSTWSTKSSINRNMEGYG